MSFFHESWKKNTELGKMQEFGFFTENVHTIAKCEKEECKIKIFLDALKKCL